MASAALRKSTEEATKPVAPVPTDNELAPAIQSIIDKGRRAGTRELPAARGVWMLPGCMIALLWACFTPLNYSPLAWIAIVPLCLLVRPTTRFRHMYRAVYLGGFVWAAITLQWMRFGHPSMYFALAALSAYIAFYFPAFLALTRVAVHRLRVPMVFAVPIVWVGLEYARAHLLTGFSWYYLGHSQYRWVELIQVSDLVGAYGVSFVVAMANAAVATVIPLAVLSWFGLAAEGSSKPATGSSRQPLFAVAATLVVLAGALVYGYQRRAAATFTEGPRVALIQPNFVSGVETGGANKANEILRTHDVLTAAAMMHGSRGENPPQRPEIVVWPESALPWPLFDVDDGLTDAELLRLIPPGAQIRHEDWLATWKKNAALKRIEDDARTLNAATLIGVTALRATKEKQEQRNSVTFVTPQMGLQGSYSKMHLVMFGEYVPLKDTFPLLSRLTPYSNQFGIEHGTEASIFEYAGARFAPVICFEDTVPHLVRGIAASGRKVGKPIDFFVNNTNDGWFHGSSELDQHLITASFRCVETRTPMVRAVNTGVSAFIDGDGVVREPDVFIDGERAGKKDPRGFTDESGRWTKGLNAALVDNVPLDNRSSVYVRTGDVFAGSCGLACLLLIGIGFATRRKQ